MGRFDYEKLPPQAEIACGEIAAAFEDLEKVVVEHLKPGREMAVTFTKLEEAFDWAKRSLLVQAPAPKGGK